MNIHTFEVSSLLTKKDYYDIQYDLRKNAPGKWEAQKEGMNWWGLPGILINMNRIKVEGYYAYSIRYKISARRFLESDNYVDLFNTKDYSVLEEKINKGLSKISQLLPPLQSCRLKRVDFCVNAELQSQEEVKAYIKVIKRGNIPPKMKIFKMNDPIAKRKKASKRDHTVVAGDFVEVSIYNKYAEMISEPKGVFPQSEIERAHNIVRLEIRCKEGKIRELMKKYKVKTIDQFMKKANRIGDEVFNYYLGKMFNEGPLYTLKDALKRIDMSEYRKKTIKILKDFITECAESKTADEVFKTYKKFYGSSRVKSIVSWLDIIETNYVTIKKSEKKIFNCESIPAPLELYRESA